MPTQTIWAVPEMFLEHSNVKVFHIYRDDDVDQGHRQYWFTVNPQCGELDRLCEDQQPPYCCGADDTPQNSAAWERYWGEELAAMKTAISAAIDRGELGLRGWQIESP